MQKRTISAGDPVPPELLNALQNPSFTNSAGEVGHIPLPPDYDNMQQWKTFSYTGSNIVANVGTWTRNAVITCGPDSNDNWPESISVVSQAMIGIIILAPILPLLDDNNAVIRTPVSYTIGSNSINFDLVQGEIAVLWSSNGSPVHKIVQSTGLCRSASVETQRITFPLTQDVNIIVETSYDVNTKHMSVSADIFTVQGKLCAESIKIGDDQHGNISGSYSGDNATIEVRAKGMYGAEHMKYRSDIGQLFAGHSFNNIAEYFIVQKGRGTFELREASSVFSKILFNKDVYADVDFTEYDAPGRITLIRVRPPAGQFESDTVATKCVIDPETGIKFYTRNGHTWQETSL